VPWVSLPDAARQRKGQRTGASRREVQDDERGARVRRILLVMAVATIMAALSATSASAQKLSAECPEGTTAWNDNCLFAPASPEDRDRPGEQYAPPVQGIGSNCYL
jgi:hypothetical protein